MSFILFGLLVSITDQGIWVEKENTMVALWVEHCNERVCLGLWVDKNWKRSEGFGCDKAISFSKAHGWEFWDGAKLRLEKRIKNLVDCGGS